MSLVSKLFGPREFPPSAPSMAITSITLVDAIVTVDQSSWRDLRHNQSSVSNVSFSYRNAQILSVIENECLSFCQIFLRTHSNFLSQLRIFFLLGWRKAGSILWSDLNIKTLLNIERLPLRRVRPAEHETSDKRKVGNLASIHKVRGRTWSGSFSKSNGTQEGFFYLDLPLPTPIRQRWRAFSQLGRCML